MVVPGASLLVALCFAILDFSAPVAATSVSTRPHWRVVAAASRTSAAPSSISSSVPTNSKASSSAARSTRPSWRAAATTKASVSSKQAVVSTSSSSSSSISSHTTTTTTLRMSTSTRTTASSTATTRTTSPVATAASTAVGVSKKKGVGRNDGALAAHLKVSWVYNWGNSDSTPRAAGVEYVPMVWSDAVDLATWTKNAQAAIKSGSTHLLAFNEPDLSSQSNMNIARTVAGWKKYMSPFVGKAKLVSPAVTNGGAPMGVAYLSAFAAACPECWAQVDAVALHWYDAAWNTGYFTNYLTDAYNTLKKPIHLTEFAGSGTSAEQQTFLKLVLPWMEKQYFIERYAGFGDFAGNYVNADGSLTALGQVYADTI